MRIYLHIGLAQVGAERLQQVLADKRNNLRAKGILFPTSPGNTNQTRLFMAVSDPDRIDSLRFNRGFFAPDRQATLRDKLGRDLAREIDATKPDTLILSAVQLGTQLYRPSELERLKRFLSQFSQDIRIIAHVDAPARILARHYGWQVLEGRAQPLNRELELAQAPDWWEACLQATAKPAPEIGQFEEIQGPPFWLDFAALQSRWESVFGSNTVYFRSFDAERFYGRVATDEICAAFDISAQIGKTTAQAVPDEPSAAGLARARQYNDVLLKLLAKRNWMLPRKLWRGLLADLQVPGEPISAASLSAITQKFAASHKSLLKAHPDLTTQTFAMGRARKDWSEADPTQGFRASQYVLAHLPRLKTAAKEERQAKDLSSVNGSTSGLSDQARAILPPLAVQNFAMLQSSPFRPHNNVGRDDTAPEGADFTPRPATDKAQGSTGNVIVGCMKNEAPYIVEWVAYHRAIGVDHFLIYTNGCDDGTAEILDRLQAMGVVEHRNNDDWRGNSPQQFALNRALKEPVIQNADWVIHIDVDEFINVRCGNGTLQDFFDHVPDATNVAMTWRLFGHNGVTGFNDRFVIDQFDTCAPKFCPKPHTVWGYKTMVKNIGAYAKLSCHRPNKLDDARRDQVKWVNGSGRDMTGEAVDKGWRSSRKSIGYDLVQLNHYALRSAESFLIKRQRGRALHVDRTIGLNYWIRMDWGDHRDQSIKRNLPRLQLEYDALLRDEDLKNLHIQGCDWHRQKAQELRTQPEFADLFAQAVKLQLTSAERVAYALALDMES